MAELIEIREQHRFNEKTLANTLTQALPDLRAPLAIRQFQGGQSNPTFLITDDGGRRYVLRKKPPGDILPSAHAVEREFAVMRALGQTDVPVPCARVLCEDSSIIGTPFYVMDYIEGRVLTDIRLTDIPVGDRANYYNAMADGLAALHRVDWQAAGLAGFGRPQAYLARQISRWTRQYLASSPDANTEMENLIAWLPAHLPADAHGNTLQGNVTLHDARNNIAISTHRRIALCGVSDLVRVDTFARDQRVVDPGDGGARVPRRRAASADEL